MSRMRAALLATLLALAPARALTAQAAPADSVTFRFAWPVGTDARVRYTELHERRGDGGPSTRVEIEGELSMHVHEHRRGLVIEHLDPLVGRFQSSPPLAADDPHRIVYARLGTPTPHYVVSPEGALLAVDGAPALGAAIESLVGPAAAEPLARELLNPALLLGSARERWNALVGMWVGTSLRVGEPVGAEAEETNPLLPSVVLPHVYQFQLVGMEPCGDAPPASARMCARLEMMSLPDPTQLEQTMNKALVDLGLPNLAFDGLAQHTQVSLLTDPATLMPYQLTVSKLVEGILKEGTESRVFRRVDGLMLVYTY
ncbi:MAG: hypothetical protein EXR95_05820 [Gemmatimonadetes bacterium]|nr:hypothetical protein [Gemmatimonadota bacterium]